MNIESPRNQGLELTLQYLGERFQNHTISCGDAQDIVIFEKILTKIAAHNMESRNKKKLNGVNVKNAFYFEFGKMSEGSAKIGISIRYAPENFAVAGGPMDPDLNPMSYMEEAFRILMKIFQGSESKETVRYFKLIKNYLKDFGKNLKNEDKIRFVESRQYANADVFYDSETRKTILNRRHKSLKRVVGSGKILGSKSDGSVYIRPQNYEDFVFKGHPNKAKTVFDGCMGSEVEFVLEAEPSDDKKMGVIKNFHYLELAPEKNCQDDSVKSCMEELDKYAKCEKGWLDGEGEKMHPAAIQDARKFVEMAPEFARRYLISPLPEGHIFIEFAFDGWEKCLKFSGKGVKAFGYDLGKQFPKFERSFAKFGPNVVEFLLSHNPGDL